MALLRRRAFYPRFELAHGVVASRARARLERPLVTAEASLLRASLASHLSRAAEYPGAAGPASAICFRRQGNTLTRSTNCCSVRTADLGEQACLRKVPAPMLACSAHNMPRAMVLVESLMGQRTSVRTSTGDLFAAAFFLGQRPAGATQWCRILMREHYSRITWRTWRKRSAVVGPCQQNCSDSAKLAVVGFCQPSCPGYQELLGIQVGASC